MLRTLYFSWPQNHGLHRGSVLHFLSAFSLQWPTYFRMTEADSDSKQDFRSFRFLQSSTKTKTHFIQKKKQKKRARYFRRVHQPVTGRLCAWISHNITTNWVYEARNMNMTTDQETFGSNCTSYSQFITVLYTSSYFKVHVVCFWESFFPQNFIFRHCLFKALFLIIHITKLQSDILCYSKNDCNWKYFDLKRISYQRLTAQKVLEYEKVWTVLK